MGSHVAEADAKRKDAGGSVQVLGSLIFILPLIGMTEFSLSMRRGVYSFDAYASVLADPQFRETFTYSVMQALFTIVFGVLLVVPTAYWVRLKLPRTRTRQSPACVPRSPGSAKLRAPRPGSKRATARFI